MGFMLLLPMLLPPLMLRLPLPTMPQLSMPLPTMPQLSMPLPTIPQLSMPLLIMPKLSMPLPIMPLLSMPLPTMSLLTMLHLPTMHLSSIAELCTPAFETVCETIEVPTKVIIDVEQCYPVTRTVCSESIQVIDNEICVYSYQQKVVDTTAKTVEVPFVKKCDTQMVSVSQLLGMDITAMDTTTAKRLPKRLATMSPLSLLLSLLSRSPSLSQLRPVLISPSTSSSSVVKI